MNPDELLSLAKQIFALKCVLTPSWDIQQQARDSLNMAMQFSLAVQAARAAGSTASAASARTDSPPASQGLSAQPGSYSCYSSGQPPPSDSTTGSSGSTPDSGSTAAATAAADPSAAQSADTDLSSKQSQTQTAADQRHIQVAMFPPVDQ